MQFVFGFVRESAPQATALHLHSFFEQNKCLTKPFGSRTLGRVESIE
jgi:hypothetical protein